MPRGKRVLKEVTEEAKQTKKAKKPSARGGRGNKKMEERATKQTTTKKRKTKAEGGWDTGQSSHSMYSAVLHSTAEEPVENDVPPPKKPKAPAQSDQTNGTEAVEGRGSISLDQIM